MSELQLISNHSTSDQFAVQTTSSSSTIFDLPQNYSLLINKLEQLALGLDSAFGNLSLDRRQLEIVTSSDDELPAELLLGQPIAAGRAPPPRHGDSHGMGEVEYSRVVSDIWIGVILTLLIVSVIFFICSCFLYHKFQQWKNSYRTNRNEPVEICRRYPPDFEAESLPSYTIVSGLPTYDDALEEFRKAGIILTPPMPIIKIFESDSKESQIYNFESVAQDGITGGGGGGSDNVSLGGCSTCTCGATQNASTTATPHNSAASLMAGGMGGLVAPQVIELSPEQLASLSQKRLSLQIAFNHSMVPRRNSRPRIDLYREVSRNNLLRTRAAVGHAGNGVDGFAPIHRSSSAQSISLVNERNLLDTRLHHLHHRGSLC